jgi:hypothetical protein
VARAAGRRDLVKQSRPAVLHNLGPSEAAGPIPITSGPIRWGVGRLRAGHPYPMNFLQRATVVGHGSWG